jgi:hypothetical protein
MFSCTLLWRKSLGVCVALRTGLRYAGTKMCSVVLTSTRSIGPQAIRPISGLTKPAIALSTVVLPLPEGPNNTVQGCVSVKLTLRETVPTRCCIFTVSRLSDNVSLPFVRLPQTGQKIDHEQRRHRDNK